MYVPLWVSSYVHMCNFGRWLLTYPYAYVGWPESSQILPTAVPRETNRKKVPERAMTCPKRIPESQCSVISRALIRFPIGPLPFWNRRSLDCKLYCYCYLWDTKACHVPQGIYTFQNSSANLYLQNPMHLGANPTQRMRFAIPSSKTYRYGVQRNKQLSSKGLEREYA